MGSRNPELAAIPLAVATLSLDLAGLGVRPVASEQTSTLMTSFRRSPAVRQAGILLAVVQANAEVLLDPAVSS